MYYFKHQKRLGQKFFILSQTRTNLLLSVQICSGLLFIFESFDFSCFQRLIGVQDEDSCGKVAYVRPRRLAEEAHGLPAESVVLHGNH
jgi:hypothetical protein